jgi:hypothetical protein
MSLSSTTEIINSLYSSFQNTFWLGFNNSSAIWIYGRLWCVQWVWSVPLHVRCKRYHFILNITWLDEMYSSWSNPPPRSLPEVGGKPSLGSNQTPGPTPSRRMTRGALSLTHLVTMEDGSCSILHGLPEALKLWSCLTSPDSMAAAPKLESLTSAAMLCWRSHHLLDTVCSPSLRNPQTREPTTLNRGPSPCPTLDTLWPSHPHSHHLLGTSAPKQMLDPEA